MDKEEPVLVTTAEGESFLVSPADEFESEVQLLRRNHAFLTLLDGLKADEGSIPLAEVERKLR